jgi:hypothetical protein
VVGSKPSIRRRSALWKRRDVVLRALRELHEGELASEVQRVARDTADCIVADYWKRDAAGAPYDSKLIGRAMRVQGKLRKEILRLEKHLDAHHALKPPAQSSGASIDVAAYRPHGVEAWRRMVEASNARMREMSANVERLSAEFSQATADARCLSLPFGNDLEFALERAQKGERVGDVEDWDVAVAIWRRFGGTIGTDGIRDERMLLDSRDAAIAYTLFARAALSEDLKDDLVAGALHELEDDRLRARRGQPGDYRGLSTHKLVSYYLWPSLEAGRKEDGPIGEEEAKWRIVVDADARLERLLAVAETAYEAVTGGAVGEQDSRELSPQSVGLQEQMREDVNPSAPRSMQGKHPAAKRKSRGKSGRPPKNPPEIDRKLVQDWTESGLKKADFEAQAGRIYGSVQKAQDRLRRMEESRKNARK